MRVRARALVLSAASPDVTAGTALSRAVSKSWDRSSRRRAAAKLRTNSINARADAQRSPPPRRGQKVQAAARSLKLRRRSSSLDYSEGEAIIFLPVLREVQRGGKV